MDSIGSTNEFAKRLLIKATPEITIPTEIVNVIISIIFYLHLLKQSYILKHQ